MKKIVKSYILIIAVVVNINIETLAMNQKKLKPGPQKEISNKSKQTTHKKKRELKANEKSQKQYINSSNNQIKIEQSAPLIKNTVAKNMSSNDCLGIVFSFLNLPLSNYDTKIMLYANHNSRKKAMTTFYKIIAKNVTGLILTRRDYLTYLTKISDVCKKLQVLNIDIDELEKFSIIAQTTIPKLGACNLTRIIIQDRASPNAKAEYIPKKSSNVEINHVIKEINNTLNTPTQNRSTLSIETLTISNIITTRKLKPTYPIGILTPIIENHSKSIKLLEANPKYEKEVYSYLLSTQNFPHVKYIFNDNKFEYFLYSVTNDDFWNNFKDHGKNHSKIIRNIANIKKIICNLDSNKKIQKEFIEFIVKDKTNTFEIKTECLAYIIDKLQNDNKGIENIWNLVKKKSNKQILDNICKEYYAFYQLYSQYPNLLDFDSERLLLISKYLTNIFSTNRSICNIIFNKNKKLHIFNTDLGVNILKELNTLTTIVNKNPNFSKEILAYIFNDDISENKKIFIDKLYQIDQIINIKNPKIYTLNIFEYIINPSNIKIVRLIVPNAAKIQKILEQNPEYWKTITECESDNLTQNIDLEFKKHDKNSANTSKLP